MTTSSPAQESFEFRAEIRQLLNILANSLYTEREIFLRELISNASDALNRMQFEMLTNREVLDPEAELAIRIAFDADAHTLTVSDSGIGMTPEQSERAFDEFYQADPTSHLGGTGLGLAITRHLCQLLGASITIVSTPGEGTTFRVHVPFAPGCEPPATA